ILYDMVKTRQTFGIILSSGDEARLYTINGINHKLICTTSCYAPGKQGRGGQSKERLDRIRVEIINEYHKRVIEKMKQYYINTVTNQPQIRGLILAGPADTKNKI